MTPNTLKLSIVLALSLATLAACDRHQKKADDTATTATTNAAVATAPATTTTAPATTAAPATGDVSGGKKAWKLACADDLKKFCADADKPGRCLREHESEISPGCKEAREAARAAHKAEKGDKAD